MDKIYKYQLLLGDFVKYEVGETSINIKSGYVIAISSVFYAIIDLDNSAIYIERIEDIEVVSNEFNTVVIRSIGSASNIKISRKLSCSSDYVCKNLCKGLKDFPDACDKVCPLRKINNLHHTYLPGDKLRNSGIITSVSFLSDYSVLNKIINRVVKGGYDVIFDMLSGSLPRPEYPYVDLSIDGVKEVLNNPMKYKLHERVYYTHSLSKGSLDINEILRTGEIVGKSFFMISQEISPCNYCIYDKNTCKNLECKLNKL